MHLKKLEIQGFKSFADKLNLEFYQGITTIVGPNGSGKSNIVDAIRWVLGEQSVKLLRGSKMEDVIFAGTENRKPVGYAKVNIVFDNSDKKFPLEYTEISITRRVYRSGESEYYINKSRCRLKDIHELLMDTGIGKDGYSIIGQGQIEKILSSRPEDRRNIFEEAAGIVKYKNRKYIAEKKLAEERQNLTRLNDIIREIENQLEPLKEQAKTTKKYLELKGKLKIYNLNLFIIEHRKLKKQLENINENIKNLSSQIEGCKIQYKNLKQKKFNLNDKLQEIDKNINDITNFINNLQMDNEKYEGSIKVFNEKIINIDNDNMRLDKMIAESKTKINEKTELISKTKLEIEKIENEINDNNTTFLLLEKTFKMINKTLRNAEVEIEVNNSNLLKNINEISTNSSKLERYKTILEQSNELTNKLLQEKEQYKIKMNEQKEFYSKLKEQKGKLLQELKKYNNILVDYQRKNKENKNQLNQLISFYNDKLNHLNSIQSRLSFLKDMSDDYEGFSNSVKKIMHLKKSEPLKWNKIHGVVADIISVSKEYELAVEIALGAGIQYIVTTDESCAKNAISYLKNKKLGRATFLPMNMIKGRNTTYHIINDIASFNGYIGIANDLIKYDNIYKNIFSRLLGNVIIIDTFDNAKILSKKYGNQFRIVTLEGEQFNIGGSITGGSYYNKKNQFLSRKREIEELNITIDKELNIIKNSNEHIENLKNQIEKDEEQYSSFVDKNKRYQEQLNNVEQELKQSYFLNDYLKNKLEETEKQINSYSNEKHSNKKYVNDYENIISKLELEKKNIQKQIENIQGKITDKKLNREKLSQQLTNLKIHINTLNQKKSSFNNNISWIGKDIDELTETIKKSYKKINLNNEQMQTIKDIIQNQQNDIKNISVQLINKKNQLINLERQKKNSNIEKINSEKEVEEYFEKLTLLEKEYNRFENLKTKYEVQMDNLREKIWEDYELTYNTSLNYEKKLGSENHIKNTIIYLKKQIKSLGNVNLKAVEEYEALSERHEFLAIQINDIIKAEEQLKKLIEQLINAMQEQFVERFKIISEEFNYVFQKLFGGGKGILRLSNNSNALESGIEIIAQPPGKKLQSMMLLSGGEKALTAIAILFAIQKMNPAPFCVLDEIEAALDDSNVNRFAVYLKELSAKTQFIVITHRKGTMEVANTLYGITMQEKGISKSVSVKFE